jgi:hypothetical protein
MKRIAVITLAAILAALAVPGLAGAQNQNWVQVQGKIKNVDCQNMVLGIRTGPTTQQLQATIYSVIYVNREPIGFCALAQYVGSYATVAVTAAGNQMVAARIDVVLSAAPPAPAYAGPPPYYYYPYYPYYYYPPISIGIGFPIFCCHRWR